MWSQVVFPSPPPRYVPSSLSRKGFSIPIFQLFTLARRFASNFVSQLVFLALRPVDVSMCKKDSLAGLEPTISTSIVRRLTVEPPGATATVWNN